MSRLVASPEPRPSAIDEDTEERTTLVVVDGMSEFGWRPSFSTQPEPEDADEAPR